MRAAGALAPLAGALLVLASCATVPTRSPSELMGVLPGDATLYASLSVPPSAALIKTVLKDAGPGFQDVATLVDMTRRMVMSVTLRAGEPPRFSIVALGDYPAFFIGLRLSGNPEWKKTRTGAGERWEWSKAGLQLGIPSNSILLASNGDVETLQGRYASPIPLTVPPEVASDMEKTDLVIYLPRLPGGLGRSVSSQDGSAMRIPIQEVWIDGTKSEGAYLVTGTANTSSEREAKLVALVLRLGIVSWMRSGNVANISEKLKSIAVSSEGSQVKLAGLSLSETEIVPLFLSLLKGVSAGETSPAEPGK